MDAAGSLDEYEFQLLDRIVELARPGYLSPRHKNLPRKGTFRVRYLSAHTRDQFPLMLWASMYTAKIQADQFLTRTAPPA
jgi:hypothetical protein